MHLLKLGGIIVISLQYDQTEDNDKTRKMFDVYANELKRLATDVGLFIYQTRNTKRSRQTWQKLRVMANRCITNARRWYRTILIASQYTF